MGGQPRPRREPALCSSERPSQRWHASGCPGRPLSAKQFHSCPSTLRGPASPRAAYGCRLRYAAELGEPSRLTASCWLKSCLLEMACQGCGLPAAGGSGGTGSSWSCVSLCGQPGKLAGASRTEARRGCQGLELSSALNAGSGTSLAGLVHSCRFLKAHR